MISGLFLHRARWAVQFLLEQLPGTKMGFSSGRDVNDLACAGIPGGRLWTRFLYLKDAKPSYFNAVAFYQTGTHCFKYRVDHSRGQILLAPGFLAYLQCKLFLGGGRQWLPPCKGSDAVLPSRRGRSLRVLKIPRVA